MSKSSQAATARHVSAWWESVKLLLIATVLVLCIVVAASISLANGIPKLSMAEAWGILWGEEAERLARLAVRPLNVLQLGDSVAASRGMRVNVTRTVLFCLAALLTAAAVSVVGAVGFLGLVAPHIARWLTGEDARRLLPVATVAGGALLLGADIVSQGITIRPPFPAPQHRPAAPVGAVMAFIGAPFPG